MFHKVFQTIALVFFLACFAYSQDWQITGFKTDIDKGLVISFTFNQDTSKNSNSRLLYISTLEDGRKDFQTEVPPNSSLSGKTLTFTIPFDKLVNTNSLEYRVNVKDESNKLLFESPATSFNIGYLNVAEKRRLKIEEIQKQLDDEKEVSENSKDLANSLRSKLQATQLNFQGEKFITNNTIVLEYNSGSIPGIVRATITNPDIVARTVESDYGKNPVIEFTGLPENKTYQIKAELLEISTNKPTTKIHTHNTRTKVNINDLSLTPPQKVIDGETVKLVFDANQDGFIQIRYAQRVGDFIKGSEKSIGVLDNNDYGAPLGEKVKAGRNEFILDSVVPGKTYSIEIKGANIYGRIMPNPVTGNIDVPQINKLAFDESQPLTADVNPLGITLTWKANFKPSKAVFVVLFDSNSLFEQAIQPDKIGSDGTISILVPVDKISSILNATNKPENKNKPKPILRAQMTDDNTKITVKQDVRFSYSLPTQPQLDQARRDNLIDEPTKRNLEEVINNAVEGKKVDWRKIFNTGLSIFFKFLL